MRPELKKLTSCTYAVKSYNSYDVNGFRFHTDHHEKTRPNPRTRNSGVLCQGKDGLDYFGIVKEIIELDCDFGKQKNPVVFKCHWFNPKRVRRRPEIGLVEIERESVYAGDDVYILAHQAIQVFYLLYPCKTVKRLLGWDVVISVPPRNKVPTPNDDDYHHRLNPNTYEGEFYQEDGLSGRLNITLPSVDEMEEDDDGITVDHGQEDGELVVNQKDMELLERMHLPDVEEPSGPPLDYVEDWWYNRDSDDDDPGPSYDPNVDTGF
jgi:hypothetical protein